MKLKKIAKLGLFTYTVVLLLVSTGMALSLTEQKDGVSAGETCYEASDCYGNYCEYPTATYCNPDTSRCECRAWDDQPVNGCLSDPYQDPPACPDDTLDCGTSSARTDTDPSCAPTTSVQSTCLGCGNPSYIVRYCKPTGPDDGGGNGDKSYYFCTDPNTCANREFDSKERCELATGEKCFERRALCLLNAPDDCPRSNLYCGDAICQTGEKCERTSSGSNTYRACTSPGRPPSGEIVPNCRYINNNAPVTNVSCKYCGDGIRQPEEQCDYRVDANCNNNCTWQSTGLDIDKEVLTGTYYEIGEIVDFRVRIVNTGSSTFTSVRFTDRYNPIYLRLLSGNALKSDGSRSISNIIPVLDINQYGVMQITNLAANNLLGPLAPGQYFEINLRFMALNTINLTCNNAYTQVTGMPELWDASCIGVYPRDTDI